MAHSPEQSSDYNQQLLKATLTEMEAERNEYRQKILEGPYLDRKGAEVTARLYDTYMAGLIQFVRENHGGLLPYAVHFRAPQGMSSPEDFFQVSFCYRDLTTGNDFTLVSLSVASMGNHEGQPLYGKRKVSEEQLLQMRDGLERINKYYLLMLKEEGLEGSISADMFFQPCLSVERELFFDKDNPFYPYTFIEVAERYFCIRWAQPSQEPTTHAIEMVFNLGILRQVVALEKKLLVPPTSTVH